MLQVTWQVTTNKSVLEYDLALKIQWYQNPAQNLSKIVDFYGSVFKYNRSETVDFNIWNIFNQFCCVNSVLEDKFDWMFELKAYLIMILVEI